MSKGPQEVHIVKIISEHKKFRYGARPAPGYKRVQAVVSFYKNSRHPTTRHVDTQDGKLGYLAPPAPRT